MRRIALAIVFGLLAISTVPQTANATGGPAPTLSTNQANCYQNIIASGDIFCLMRYELPTFTTATPPPGSPEAWCAELVDQDGCIADPVEPTNETSLITSVAFVTLYQNCGVDCSTGTLESQVRAPRINHALGGAYLAPGHAVTFGDITVNGCVESSTTLFTTSQRSCVPVFWNSAATDQASQLTQLGSDLIGNLVSIESNRNLALFSYVSNNLITSAGRVLSLEALSVMDQIIPTRFQAATEASQNAAFATPTGTLALQTSLDASAAARDLPGAFDALGTTVFGISGGAFATIFFLAIGLGLFIWLNSKTKEFVIPTAGFVTMALVGMYVRGPTISVVAVAAVAFALVGGMFLLRKVGT